MAIVKIGISSGGAQGPGLPGKRFEKGNSFKTLSYRVQLNNKDFVKDLEQIQKDATLMTVAQLHRDVPRASGRLNRSIKATKTKRAGGPGGGQRLSTGIQIGDKNTPYLGLLLSGQKAQPYRLDDITGRPRLFVFNSSPTFMNKGTLPGNKYFKTTDFGAKTDEINLQLREPNARLMKFREDLESAETVLKRLRGIKRPKKVGIIPAVKRKIKALKNDIEQLENDVGTLEARRTIYSRKSIFYNESHKRLFAIVSSRRAITPRDKWLKKAQKDLGDYINRRLKEVS